MYASGNCSAPAEWFDVVSAFLLDETTAPVPPGGLSTQPSSSVALPLIRCSGRDKGILLVGGFSFIVSSYKKNNDNRLQLSRTRIKKKIIFYRRRLKSEIKRKETKGL
jgi:hypothetical protein